MGSRVLITGGADGIGAVTTTLFLKRGRGAEVFVADIESSQSEAQMAGLQYFKCDAGFLQIWRRQLQ